MVPFVVTRCGPDLDKNKRVDNYSSVFDPNVIPL